MLGSRALGHGASFLVTVLVGRQLGPVALGLYAFALVVATLLSEVPGAGLDLSAVRLGARDWITRPARVRGVLLVAATTKGVWTLGVASALLLLAEPLGRLLGRPELASPLRFGAITGVALAMTEYLFATLQIQERFGRILVVNVIAAASRLVPVAFLVRAGAFTLPRALLVLTAAACATCAAALLAVWRPWRGPVELDRGSARELLTVGRWLVLSAVINALSNNLDVLTLAQFAGSFQTGIYTSGRSLALPLLLVSGAVGAILVPRLSRLAATEAVAAEVHRIARLANGAAALLAVTAITLGPPLVPLVFGPRYVEAIPVFRLLAVVYCVQIATWPRLAVLLVFHHRPDLIPRVSLLGLSTGGFGYLLAVPRFGAVGAAWVTLATHLVLMALCARLARSILRRPAPGRS
jgi:O-antigen/teichoic acid export membrane protein